MKCMESNEVDINASSEDLLAKAPAGDTAVPEAAAAPSAVETPAAPIPSAADAPHFAPIRTFSSDMAEAIRSKGGSVVRIAIAEEEKRRRAYEENSIRSKKNIALIAASIVLVVAALGIAWYSYSRRVAPPENVLAPQTAPASIIPTEDWAVLDVTGMQVTDVLAKVHAVVAMPNIEPGAAKNLVLAEAAPGGQKQAIPVARFLTALGAHAPAELVRALKQDFMLGVYRYQDGSLFLIIHGSAHDFLLSGMLAWERDLFPDLAPLFGIETSGYTKTELENMPFADTIVQNRDARAVMGADGRPLLFYSFIDQSTIVIASDPRAFFEVVRRY